MILCIDIHGGVDFHWYQCRILSGQLLHLFYRLICKIILFISGRGFFLFPGQLEGQLCIFRQIVLCFCNIAMIQHQIQRFISSLTCIRIEIAFGILIISAIGIIAVRCIDHPGQKRTLRKIEILNIFSKIIFRTLLYTAGTVTEIDFVQIFRNNILF